MGSRNSTISVSAIFICSSECTSLTHCHTYVCFFFPAWDRSVWESTRSNQTRYTYQRLRGVAYQWSFQSPRSRWHWRICFEVHIRFLFLVATWTSRMSHQEWLLYLWPPRREAAADTLSRDYSPDIKSLKRWRQRVVIGFCSQLYVSTAHITLYCTLINWVSILILCRTCWMVLFTYTEDPNPACEIYVHVQRHDRVKGRKLNPHSPNFEWRDGEYYSDKWNAPLLPLTTLTFHRNKG